MGYRIKRKHNIGWTEAQELNAAGWNIRVISGKYLVYFPGGVDELEFNEGVRAHINRHGDAIFNAALVIED